MGSKQRLRESITHVESRIGALTKEQQYILEDVDRIKRGLDMLPNPPSDYPGAAEVDNEQLQRELKSANEYNEWIQNLLSEQNDRVQKLNQALEERTAERDYIGERLDGAEACNQRQAEVIQTKCRTITDLNNRLKRYKGECSGEAAFDMASTIDSLTNANKKLKARNDGQRATIESLLMKLRISTSENKEASRKLRAIGTITDE